MRLLIATGVVVPDSEVPASVGEIIRSATHILVMSPGLVGPLHWLTGDVDHAQHVAEDRLAAVVEQLSGSTSASVEGVRGDELLKSAFDDALRGFEADHVIIAVGSKDYDVWHRQRVVEHLLGFGMSVTVFRTAT
jgi:hypothetical protein